MSASLSQPASAPAVDRVSDVLKWVLLVVAVTCFALLGYSTKLTYEAAPPLPDQISAPGGQVLMTSADIVDGKAGFQRADLMDYGSLYGMGSYFGPDYTADNLVRVAALVQNNLSRARFGRPFASLALDDQASVKTAMQSMLQGVDLTQRRLVLAAPLAQALSTRRAQIADELLRNDFERGWTQAFSLDATSAGQTADFLLYSSLTTVAHRPGTGVSWTQNWPYEPLVGNTPTGDTFRWT